MSNSTEPTYVQHYQIYFNLTTINIKINKEKFQIYF